jgi:transcriptional regulator with XRE-family HTH domain
MEPQSNLNPQFNTCDQQKCFIAYTHKASWSEDILAACTEVLPRFGLEPWYADDQFEPGRSLKEKVVEMIANARYGIFDLSAMYDNESREWVMPRNVLIELGIAIALNRPVLLLRAKENRLRGCPLPACLAGIDDIIEFSGEPTLKRALEERIPQWLNVSPDKMWWTRYCLFGGCDCEYREVHPRMERWQQEGLHCHIADGPDADRVDFRCLIEDEMGRYNDLTFAYLDTCKPTHPYHFVQCAHCQAVRSSQFAIYRITPQTDAETYIAIGMSIALSKQFGYEIPKIFFTADVHEVPSLLSGYEVVEAVSTKVRRQRLRKALPVVMQRVQECVWKPRVLPFERVLPIVQSLHVRLGGEVEGEEPMVTFLQKTEEHIEANAQLASQQFTARFGHEAVEEGPIIAKSRRIVPNEQLKRERELRGWDYEDVAGRIDLPDYHTVIRWERGVSFPSARYRRELSRIFGKSLEELGLLARPSNEGGVVATSQPVDMSKKYSPNIWLRRERERRGWTYKDVADRIELPDSDSVGRWERGVSFPSARYRRELSRIFGKSLEELGLVKPAKSEEMNGDANDTITATRQEKDLAESYSGLQLDPLHRCAWIDGSPLSKPLTEEEFKLLHFLAKHVGEVCPREETIGTVYGGAYIPTFDDPGLDRLIEQTRQKIGDGPRSPRFIETVGDVGHRLNGYIGERS